MAEKKKKKKHIDRHLNPRKAFHAPAELFKRLGKFCAASTPEIDESTVMRMALDVFLKAKGY